MRAERSAPVNRVLLSSIVDGPGNRAVVFVQGCNYNCVYCHNPETIALCAGCGVCVEHCPAGAIGSSMTWRKDLCTMCDACIKACPHSSCPRTRELSPADVMNEIEPALAFIRGVTVSGGECTLYPDFLLGMFRLAREKNLTCFLDTNGSFDFESSPELLDLTDGVMVDIKAVSDCARVIGVDDDGAGVLDRAVFLAERRKLWEVRTVIEPSIMDAAETVTKTCEAIAPADSNVRYKLIKYRPVGVRREYANKLEPPSDSLMEELAEIVGKYSMTPVII